MAKFEKYMQDKTEKGQTAFNSGLAKLERIDTQRKIMHAARIADEWNIFFTAMQGIRSEIYERMNKEERQKSERYEIEMHELLKKSHRTQRIPLKPFWDYEKFLSDLEYKYGFSMPDKKDASEAGDL